MAIFGNIRKLPFHLNLFVVMVSTPPLWVFVIGSICFNANVPSIIGSPLFPNFDNEVETLKLTMDIFNSWPKAIFKDEKIGFHLYTEENQKVPFSLKTNDLTNLRESPLKRDRSMKILIHGWMEITNSEWLNDILSKYLNAGDYNIIIVDWDSLSLSNYPSALNSSRMVGEKVAEFIKFLNLNEYIKFENIHIVGFSLGAHIAGLTGSILEGKIGRITGLDPAGPDFEVSNSMNEDKRLDSSDAKFVDVIHTCGGVFGYAGAIGHVDFYPNGGISRQPGCPMLNSWGCSHLRARQFMIESIKSPEAFIATKCNSWEEYTSNNCTNETTTFMGENVYLKSRGIFFLETNEQSPFGKNHPNLN